LGDRVMYVRMHMRLYTAISPQFHLTTYTNIMSSSFCALCATLDKVSQPFSQLGEGTSCCFYPSASLPRVLHQAALLASRSPLTRVRSPSGPFCLVSLPLSNARCVPWAPSATWGPRRPLGVHPCVAQGGARSCLYIIYWGTLRLRGSVGSAGQCPSRPTALRTRSGSRCTIPSPSLCAGPRGPAVLIFYIIIL
jgi:hypothetical protein